MNFREWQAEYNAVLDDILVQEVEPLDLSLAREVAIRMWTELISSERVGYGVFKSRQPDGYCTCGRTEAAHAFDYELD